MRYLTMTAAGACLLAMSLSAGAAPSQDTAPRFERQPAIVLAQTDTKKETVTQKVKKSVKKAWRNLTGYKFDVACVFNRTTCTETGKDREDARGKCMAAHPLCSVSDAK